MPKTGKAENVFGHLNPWRKKLYSLEKTRQMRSSSTIGSRSGFLYSANNGRVCDDAVWTTGTSSRRKVPDCLAWKREEVTIRTPVSCSLSKSQFRKVRNRRNAGRTSCRACNLRMVLTNCVASNDDWSLCLCVDYPKQNVFTVRESYLVLPIDLWICFLSDAKIVSTLDASDR